MFIKGFKKLFKNPIFLVIFISFIFFWVMLTIGGFSGNPLINTTTIFGLMFLISFNFTLFVFSFFKRISKMNGILIFVIFLLSFITFIFLFFYLNNVIPFLFRFFFYTNQIVTGLFAFKFCMDTSTNVDNFLYRKKSKNLLRTLEFIIFGIMVVLFLVWSWWFFRKFGPEAKILAPIFFIILWVDTFLMIVVIIRAIIFKRFAAYITFFFLLNFFYVLYIIFSIIYKLLTTTTGGFLLFSFVIDLIIFTLILVSIFGKVDYLEDKLKIIKADTIALFLFIMKIFIQIADLRGIKIIFEVQLAWMLFSIFIGATLIFGIYSIFAHKEGKKKN